MEGLCAASDAGCASPQVWFASRELLGLGGAIGPVLAYKRLVIQLPLSVSRVAQFDNHWSTSRRAVVFSPVVFAGIRAGIRF